MTEPVARAEFDLRIKLPCHALIVGPSMSGKTRLALALLERPELFCPKPRSILFYYDQLQPRYLEAKKSLAAKGIDLHLHRGHEANLDDLPHNEEPTILLIDDSSEETASSKSILRIATNGRHKNICKYT